MIGEPNVFAPTVEAMVAVPTLIDHRRAYSRDDDGRRERQLDAARISPAVMPTPRAASRAEPGTATSPAIVFCTIGSTP